jgi:predicted RND superfamily exporter protein
MKMPFFARHGLLVLMAVFFTVPFALRGARMAVQNVKNDIKDWLPDDFVETTELDWFRDNFLGEQFVVISWDGASREDADGKIAAFEELLVPDTQPPNVDIGSKFGLYVPDENYDNWGGENEKWLAGQVADEQAKWYYLLPSGKLYRWDGAATLAGAAKRAIQKSRGTFELEGVLVAEADPADYEDPSRLEAPLFKTVTSGPEVLARMTREDGALRQGGDRDMTEEAAQEVALQRLEGTLFGPEGDQTVLVVTLTDVAKADLNRVLGRGGLGKPRGRLLRMAESIGINAPAPPPMFALPSLGLGHIPETPSPRLRLGGPPVDNVAIDEAGNVTLVRLVGLCFIVGVGLSLLCFRSWKITIMLFFVGGVSAIASLGFVFYFGYSVDAVLLTMPAVVYVLGLSGAVHIANYYRDAAMESGLLSASDKAVSHGWKPCVLAAVTTAIGFGSLCTSNLHPIWKFGFFSAIGVLATLALLFTYLPAVLQLYPPYSEKYLKKLRKQEEERGEDLFDRAAGRAASFIVRHNIAASAICGAIMIAVGIGLTKMNTSVQLLALFDSQENIIQDYTWLERHLGKLVPMELVLRFERDTVKPGEVRATMPTGDEDQDAEYDPALAAEAEDDYSDAALARRALQYNFLQRMEAAERVHKVVERQFGEDASGVVGKAMSAATFVPELPGPAAGLFDATARLRNGYNSKLADHFDEFVETDYIRIDPKDDAELWRISLRLGALGDVDYGSFVSDLRTAVEPVMAAYHDRDRILGAINEARDGAGFRGAEVVLLGYPPEADAQWEAPPLRPKNASELHVAPADQTLYYATTLRELLINAGVKVRTHDKGAETDDALAGYIESADIVGTVDADLAAGIAKLANTVGDDKRFDLTDHHPTIDTVAANADTNPVASPSQPWTGPAVATVYTGVVPVVYKAQRTLLESLVKSIGWAFALIAVVMMLLLRSSRAGLISMIPNLFPVVIIFGLMGWSEIAIDIGSMMTASVAMGVAVDDTVHFLTWFRWGLNDGLDRKEAIKLAFKKVSRAMAQTTAIGGLGLAVFALSSFTPTQRFGYLMLSLLTAALVGDLIFLPALLAGPLGGVFKGSSKDRPHKTDDTRDEVAAETDSGESAEPTDVADEGTSDEDRAATSSAGGPSPPHADFKAGADSSAARAG